MKKISPAKLVLPVIAALLIASCAKKTSSGYQGYLEGDFIYVAAPLGGQLEKLAVTKGARVTAGAPLFTLERANELAAQRQAADQLRTAEARLADLKKGSRPSEIAAQEARVEQARAAAELSQLDFARQENLYKTGVVAVSDFDRARLTRERDRRATDELVAQLATARLGGRTDAIAAAESEVSAATAAREKSDWSVAQKSLSAPRDALVYDTLYREGEFVAAGNPVVALLPAENIKVRFFVSETDFAAVKAGDTVQVSLSGHASLAARVSYLSPQPEYTPPILYNRENRSKLVFMIEAIFTDASAAKELHPGQPVDVTLMHP